MVAVGTAFGAVAFAPIAFLAGSIEPRALVYAAPSVVAEVGYFLTLAAGYDRAPLSVVYPVARGMAPVIVLVVSVVALGSGVSPLAALGVVGIALGVVLLRGLTRARRSDGVERGMAFGVATAGFIATYTLLDSKALAYADPLPYLEVVLAPTAVVMLAIVGRRRGLANLRRAATPGTLAAGIGIFAAYGLTLAALALGPVALVAAVRESSVLLATAFAAILLRERVDREGWIGACAVAGGIVAIAVS